MPHKLRQLMIMNRILMSVIIVLILLCAWQFYAKNQETIRLRTLGNPNQVLTVDDKVYKTRSSIFRSLEKPDAQHKIVFLGDSITQNCNWNELFSNDNILNRGISGDTTAGILKRIDDIVYLKPTKLFLMAGINDFSLGRTAQQVTRNDVHIIDTIRHELPATKIYVQSTLPINNSLNKYATTPAQIEALNANLQKICREKRIVFINLYPFFTNSTQHLKIKYTFDGTHLNGKGYQLWKNKIKRYVD